MKLLEASWDEFVDWVESVQPGVFDLIPSDDSPILRKAVLDKISEISGEFYNSLRMVN